MRSNLLAFLMALLIAGTAALAVPTFAQDGNGTATDDDYGEDDGSGDDDDQNETDDDRGKDRRGSERGPGGHGDRDDDDDRRQAQDSRQEAKREARDTRHEAAREARDRFHEQRDEARAAFDECMEQENATREECRRETAEEIRNASQHFRVAKQRIQDEYKERLHSARLAYLEHVKERREAQDERHEERCKSNESCVLRHIERLEARQHRAAVALNETATKIAEIETQLADDNLTRDEEYRLQDRLYGLKIAQLKLERLEFRTSVALEGWYEALRDLQDDEADDAAGNDDNTTA